MVAQTTKDNSESTAVAIDTKIEELQATTTMDWKQILVLQGVSAKDQDSNRQIDFFSLLAARLGKMYDRITGPAATDQERRQASLVMASTRSKSFRLY